MFALIAPRAADPVLVAILMLADRTHHVRFIVTLALVDAVHLICSRLSRVVARRETWQQYLDV